VYLTKNAVVASKIKPIISVRFKFLQFGYFKAPYHLVDQRDDGTQKNDSSQSYLNRRKYSYTQLESITNF
jgi:hypothetical protein